VEDLSWNSPSLTIVLASLHAFLYLSSLLLTFRPALTLFHIFLATQTVAFVLRPILSVADGGFSLYGGPLAFYNEGLFLNLLANFLAALGYLAVYARRYPKASQPYRYSRSSLLKGTWISFALGLTALALIHFLSGGAWLPNARGEAITRVVPFGKVLFPLAVVSFSFSLASSILLIFFMLREAKSPLPKNFVGLLFLLLVGVTSAVSLILLYQRGFLLTALLVSSFFVARLQNWGYIKLMVIGLLSLVLLTQIRPTAQLIANLLSGEVPSAPANIEEQPSFLKRNFLYAPNFDTVDVWPIVLSYIADNGYKGGSTYLAVPFRFFPPSLRLQYGSLTAVDELNVYYWGNVYWEKSFGFAVSLAQEAYLNFGLLGFILPLLAGMLGAWLDRWLWTLSLLTTTRMYGVFAAFHTGIPTSEMGGVAQWALAYLFTGFFIGVFSSLSLKSSANRMYEQR